MYRDDKIRAAMAVQRITNAEIAERTGVNRELVANISNGRAEDAKLSTLKKIGDVLGLSLSDLFEPMPEPKTEVAL